ncbi:peptidoglycan-recognition protein LB isoform X2 [Bactrocera oleae]|uniref:peptidoglycan-recognition protein LB isoform X2 n=1 Tax=Bactrocera oleae TaxID=104688 RepID=UPI00174D0EB9|nr:peptidoglycan-recognition protein LB isoform X2 [Bactrocera oleae]
MTAFGLFLLSMWGFGQQMPATHTQIISRANWGARPSTLVEHFNGPAPYVIIHHSYMPSACYTAADCIKAMRSMQDYHQLQRGWNDIGYSFAIGGDGMIYVGRGFNVIGAHAPKYNDRSVGICMIGDWRTELPPPQMLAAAKSLIEFGLTKGYIHSEYKLLAHRQVRNTECPGQRLYEEITTWPHFAPKPQSTENEIAK